MTHKREDGILSDILRDDRTGNLKCVGYARVSTQEQVHSGLGLAAQQRGCQKAYEYRYQDRSYSWGGMYVDKGVTSKIPLTERPEGRKLFTDLERGNLIIALRSDRLFRSVKDMSITMEDFLRRGIGVFMVDNSLEVMQQGSGMMIFSIMSAVAQFEREVIQQRTKEAGHERRMLGVWDRKKPPLGFRFSTGRTLIPDNHERVVMARIMKWRNQGSTVEHIKHFLKTENVRRTQTQCFFTKGEVQRAEDEELKLREIQRRIQAGELDALLIPPQYRNMHTLPACSNLFPLIGRTPS